MTAAGRPITPRRTTTRRHHAAPDTWDRERIVAAIASWAQETGMPPRSLDFCPSAARAAGYVGAELTKWEREHPRFPGNSTVYRYFESWADALEAAGLRPYARRGTEGTLSERVAAAKRMRADGEPVRAIADHLGIALTTAYRYLKARPCRTCENSVVGEGEVCHVCATRSGNPRRWSEKEVLEAVREWARLEGRPPVVEDWRPHAGGGVGRWDAEFPRWPPASMGRILFGSWNRMLHAADVVPNHPSWTDAEILAALRRYRDEFARAPAKQDLDWPPQGYPSARTVRRHFGSFTAGIRAAGLEPAQRRFSRARLIELIREFNAEHGRPPRSTDWAQASERWPSAATVQNRFGTWAAALEAAGVPPVVGRRRSSTCA